MVIIKICESFRRTQQCGNDEEWKLGSDSMQWVSEELSSVETLYYNRVQSLDQQVSEELSSVETIQFTYKASNSYKVSEELSSVETSTDLLIECSLWIVSEELSSVETTSMSSYPRWYHRKVSEELSSVETRQCIVSFISSYQFQKNLVVWKHTQRPAYLHKNTLFQKNLVVWKHLKKERGIRDSECFRRTQQCGNIFDIKPGTSYALRFQKNLVVWKHSLQTGVGAGHNGFQKNLVVWKPIKLLF